MLGGLSSTIPRDSSCLVQLDRVYLAYEEPVLRGARLHARKGELVGLIGLPGAGKSLLLRCIAGLDQVDAGSIVVFGQELFGASEAEVQAVQAQMGMLFQNIALFDHLSVIENVAFPLRRQKKWTESQMRQRAQAELDRVSLSSLANRAPGTLSGGQQRRVGIARAAVSRPQLLLYDEPAAGLDPVTSSRIFELIAQQGRQTGASTLIVSSDIARLLRVVDSVAFMHRGRIVYQGPPREFRQSSHPLITSFYQTGDCDVL